MGTATRAILRSADEVLSAQLAGIGFARIDVGPCGAIDHDVGFGFADCLANGAGTGDVEVVALIEKNFIAQVTAMLAHGPPNQTGCASDEDLQIVCTCAPYCLR